MAQEINVINNYGTGDSNLSEENYVLKSVTTRTFVINEYEPTNTGIRSHIEQMANYGLKSYTDDLMHVFNGRVEIVASPDDFIDEASQIVKNAVWIHDQPFSELFEGFSDRVKEKVRQIKRLDGYTVRKAPYETDPAIDGTIGLYSFQLLVYNLKLQLAQEVVQFLDGFMPQRDERDFGDPNNRVLQVKDFTINPVRNNISDLADLKPADIDFSDPEKDEGKSNRRRRKDSKNDALTDRIVELLESNNKILANYDQRFGNIQQQIDELKRRPSGNNDDVKNEIAELRKLITQIAEREPAAVGSPNPIAATLPEMVTVNFEKNEYQVTLSQQALLNQIVLKMQSGGSRNAQIIGYADKIGDAAFNAKLSKLRAEAVQAYLMSQGIAPARLQVNFFGATESKSQNPADRKVEIRLVANGI